jgi:hypothetical protein
LLLWVTFLATLVFSRGTLDSVWHWLVALPLVGQIVLWVLFLPVVAGLWIWESGLVLWLILIFTIAVGNIAAFNPRPGPRRRKTSTV